MVNLKSLPEPDFSSFVLPEKHICIITDKGTPATGILAQSLVERNWKVVVLSFPTSLVPTQSALPEGVQRVTLTDMSEEQLQQKLAEISSKYGPVGAVIHLNPAGLTNDDIFSAEQKEIIKQVFLLAKHLKEPLTQVAKSGNSVFMVVTNLDGEFGLGEKIDFDPISGGLFGLVKTLNLEWEDVFCRAIDITPEMDDEQAAERIIAELYDPNRLITEVGYSARGRSTLVVEQPVLC